MIYRQRRKVSQVTSGNRASDATQKERHVSKENDESFDGQKHNTANLFTHHDNYMPDVMTLHSLGVTATSVEQQQMASPMHHVSGSANKNYSASHMNHVSHQQSWHGQDHRHRPYSGGQASTRYPSSRYPGSRSQQHAGPRTVHPQSAPSAQSVFTEPQRLHKLLAHAGLGSRRMMEQLIFEGRISVNSRPAEIGQKVGPNDIVRINGQVVKFDFRISRPRILLYYKPEGEIVSRDDPANRNTVFTRLPKLVGARWVSVGRLDYNTSGLLLFTTSGDLANRLMHPRFEIEREYSVRIRGALTEEQIRQLTDGIMLDDGPAAFLSLVDAHPDAEYLKDGNFQLHEPCNRWYRVVLAEGRNREVRKMFEAIGIQVTRLVRIRYGDVFLPQSLRRGQWRELDARQVARFMERVSRSTPTGQVSSAILTEGDMGDQSDADVDRPFVDTQTRAHEHGGMSSGQLPGPSASRHPLQRRRWLGMRRRSMNNNQQSDY